MLNSVLHDDSVLPQGFAIVFQLLSLHVLSQARGLSLHTDAAEKFRWGNTPAENPQPLELAKYSSLLAFIESILGEILNTSHTNILVPIA